MKIYIEHTIDAGHRIVGHKGKCARLHGHTYRFEIWLEAMALSTPGFVVDFGDIKDLLNEWDHRMLLWDQDPIMDGPEPQIWLAQKYGVTLVPFNPTAERMAGHIREEIISEYPFLDGGVVRLWETPKAYAEVTW